MKAKGNLAYGAYQTDDHRTTVVLELYGEKGDEVNALRNKLLDVEIKAHRNHRSINANNLCWMLCTEIGRAIQAPKEVIYQHAIRDVGEYTAVQIIPEALPAFKAAWTCHGTGWFVEQIDESDGLITAFAYHGSSSYDTKAMSVLIDYLVDQAMQMELQIGYDLSEIDKIKNEWRMESC